MSLSSRGSFPHDPIDLTEDLQPHQHTAAKDSLRGMIPNGKSSHDRSAIAHISSIRQSSRPDHSTNVSTGYTVNSLPASPRGRGKGKSSSSTKSQEEKRLRRFRPTCPATFDDVYQRATSQRFYVLERYRVGSPGCPEEIVELTGSTGNIYHVHITRTPKCTCPHAEKGNQCKHMIYVRVATKKWTSFTLTCAGLVQSLECPL
jgi:hypothetical protein